MENIEIEIIKLGVFARSAIYLRALLLALVTRVAGKSKSQRKWRLQNRTMERFPTTQSSLSLNVQRGRKVPFDWYACTAARWQAWCRINDKAFECNARRMLVLRPGQRGIHGDWSEGNSSKLWSDSEAKFGPGWIQFVSFRWKKSSKRESWRGSGIWMIWYAM